MGLRIGLCLSWDLKDEGEMLDGGMARNVFLVRRFSKMKSSDLYNFFYFVL